MEKRQLIEEIRKYNTTVAEAFLLKFELLDLREYLDHLEAARRKETLIAGWVKPRQQMRIAS